MNVLVLATTAAVVASATAGSALAAGPVITYDNDQTPQTITDWGDCPGFQIDASFMAQRRNENFYDSAGNLLLQRRHIDFTGTLYNATDPSLAVVYEGHFNRTFDAVAETLTITGLSTRVIVPGSGVVDLAAGQTTIDLATGDVVAHGPSGDTAALCEALS